MAEKTAEETSAPVDPNPHPDSKEPEDALSASKDSTKDTQGYEMDSHDGGEGESSSQKMSKESSSSGLTGGESIEELLRARVDALRREGVEREKEMKVEYAKLQNEKAHLKQEVDHAIAVKKAEADIREEKERRQAAAVRARLANDPFHVETDIIREALRGLDDEDETDVRRYKEKRALPRPEPASTASHVAEKNVNKKPTASAPDSEPVKEMKPNGASPVPLPDEK